MNSKWSVGYKIFSILQIRFEPIWECARNFNQKPSEVRQDHTVKQWQVLSLLDGNNTKNSLTFFTLNYSVLQNLRQNSWKNKLFTVQCMVELYETQSKIGFPKHPLRDVVYKGKIKSIQNCPFRVKRCVVLLSMMLKWMMNLLGFTAVI